MKLIQPITLGLVVVASLASTAFALPRSSVQNQHSPQSAPVYNGLKKTPGTSRLGGSDILRGACPQGQIPSSWQKPIYDKNGLFVVGWETVATCIPKGLQPAG